MNPAWMEKLLATRPEGPVLTMPGESAALTVQQITAARGAAVQGGGWTLLTLSRSGPDMLRYLAALGTPGMVPAPIDEAAPPSRTAQVAAQLGPSDAGGTDGLAIVLTTSGSTGRPKAVGLRSSSLDHFARAASQMYGLRATDRILVAGQVDGDYLLEEVLLTLGSGATGVVLPPDADPSDPGFPEWLARHGVTVLDLPLTRFRVMATALERTGQCLPGCVRMLLLGGEPLRAADVSAARRLSEAGIEIWNLYGPTETTVMTTAYRVPDSSVDAAGDERDGALPIGHPVPGARCHVVDAELRAVPDGMPGELLIGGPGLADRYVGDPRATAACFVPDGFGAEAGARLYRTGDRVVREADGTYRILGRLDDQVKIRGFRVEPGEVEAALLRLDGVDLAAVRAVPDAGGRPQLVAYVPESAPPATLLRDRLAAVLPDYMTPVGWVRVDEFPLTPTGKIDRHRLPEGTGALPREPAGSGADTDAAATLTATERLLAQVWCEVLAAGEVRAEDSFFALGGQSREGVQVVSVLRERHTVDLGLADLLKRPVLRDLAAFLDTRASARATD